VKGEESEGEMHVARSFPLVPHWFPTERRNRSPEPECRKPEQLLENVSRGRSGTPRSQIRALDREASPVAVEVDYACQSDPAVWLGDPPVGPPSDPDSFPVTLRLQVIGQDVAYKMHFPLCV
jgi:hypothetical protein